MMDFINLASTSTTFEAKHTDFLSYLGSTVILYCFLRVLGGRLKMRDMKMRDQIAGVENAVKVSMESQSVKKCLKVVAFVCRVIPSV